MSNVILTIGIPASGKSYWAIAESKRTGAMIVCRDDIRKMLGLGWNEDEAKVTRLAYALITGLVDTGADFIVADTNINQRNRERLITYIGYGNPGTIELKFFPISVEEAIARDDVRGDARVGPDVIRNMQKNYHRQFGV